MPHRPESETSAQIELVSAAQPTLATIVRSSYPELTRALSDAFELLAGTAALNPGQAPRFAREPAGTHRHLLVALQQLATSEVELVASVKVDIAPLTSRPIDCSEVPAGRYLTLTTATDAASVARVLPTLRDWLGEHRESPVGSLLLQVVSRPDGGSSLVTRLRVQGGLVARRASLLAHEGGLEAVVAALTRVSLSHPTRTAAR
jgi:hypothetical protein